MSDPAWRQRAATISKVKVVYPNAAAVRHGTQSLTGWVIWSGGDAKAGNPIGRGPTKIDAWRDAAGGLEP